MNKRLQTKMLTGWTEQKGLSECGISYYCSSSASTLSAHPASASRLLTWASWSLALNKNSPLLLGNKKMCWVRLVSASISSLWFVDWLTIWLKHHMQCSASIASPVTGCVLRLQSWSMNDIDPFSTFKNLQSPFKLVDVLQPILTKHVMKSGLPRVIEQYGCRFYHYKSDSVCNSLLLNRLLKNAMLDMQMQQRHCSAKPVCQVHDTRTHNNNVICSAIKNVLQNKCRGYYTWRVSLPSKEKKKKGVPTSRKLSMLSGRVGKDWLPTFASLKCTSTSNSWKINTNPTWRYKTLACQACLAR